MTGRTAVVITASDRCAAGTQIDFSGPLLVRMLQGAGAQVVDSKVIPDDLDLLVAALRNAAKITDLILTTGGTGLAPRDVTPERPASLRSFPTGRGRTHPPSKG